MKRIFQAKIKALESKKRKSIQKKQEAVQIKVKLEN
jgi:hypothetical protein